MQFKQMLHSVKSSINAKTFLKEEIYGHSGERVSESSIKNIEGSGVPVTCRGLFKTIDWDGANVYGSYYETRTYYTRGTGFFSFLKYILPNIAESTLNVNYVEPIGRNKTDHISGTISASIPFKRIGNVTLSDVAVNKLSVQFPKPITLLDKFPEEVKIPDWWMK